MLVKASAQMADGAQGRWSADSLEIRQAGARGISANAARNDSAGHPSTDLCSSDRGIDVCRSFSEGLKC
jgi:hypothetical protein